MTTELHYQSARKLAAMLANKEISARELLNHHLKRNELWHGKINAVVETDIDAAQQEAARIDETRTKGVALGPLAGLPMTVKDGYDITGMPATAGNPEWANRNKDCPDAALVRLVKEAGGVFWGKTNVPFMLSDFQSFNEIFGTTNNPWDLARTPGGSSGGSAAALAAGITPLELGSDIGGSLRHPANFCGVTALKPTHGQLPNAGHVPPPPGMHMPDSLSVVGPMARTVDDLRLLHSVLKGEREAKRRDVRSLRIAVWNFVPTFPLDTEIAAHVEQAGAALKAAGATVGEACPDIDCALMMETYIGILTPIILTGMEPAADDPVWETKNQLKEQLAKFFDDWDVVLMPVSPVSAFTHRQEGEIGDRVIEVNGAEEKYSHILDWISPATLLGPPALATRAGQTKAGLPVGVQILGKWADEDTLFDVGEALDEAFPFLAPPGP